MTLSPTVLLAQDLIRRQSVTPADAGCQQLLAQRLEALGFTCETMQFEDVTNLWATRGTGEPLLVFAGHTDVVPTGPLEQWKIAPFEGRVENGMLHGRGAADMKGSIACFITACERFIGNHPDHHGKIGLLITSDEEGPARWGTRAVMDELNNRGDHIDMCIVGEPTSHTALGDTIKVGRRGSIGATLRILGKQGHIAYPHLAENPVHRATPVLAELLAEEWDQGNDNFQPTSFQVSSIQAGTGATNVIPGELEIGFNLRYSPEITDDHIRHRVESILDAHELEYDIDWLETGKPFETRTGELITTVEACVESVTGIHPQRSTSGGTSDGRFIAPAGTQVVELGPVNATIHKIDEQVPVDNLEQLTLVYEGVLRKLLS